MDVQKIADSFETMTCIMSVEKLPGGGYGTIRIEAGNEAYVKSIEDFSQVSASSMLKNTFIPGSEYEKYIPKNPGFENMCFRSAVQKKPIHTYIKPDVFEFWINVTMMPLASDDPNKGYCTYSQELTTAADVEMLADVSAKTSADVLRICLKLSGAKDFTKTMNEVIYDLRMLCHAKHCIILLTDEITRSCSVLCESLDTNSDLKPMAHYINKEFYDLTLTWEDMIEDKSCLIINNEQDMDIIKQVNPAWYESLKGANVRSLVLFPLIYNRKLFGYIWATNCDTSKTPRIREVLELTCFVLASEIASQQMIKRLEQLSVLDMLTGVKNRNAMNNRVDEFVRGEVPKKPFGVIFADINGLKVMNDRYGHAMGDMVLKSAADVMCEIFPRAEIYRAGGDEFMAILLGVGESELEECAEKLRGSTDECCVVSISVGTCYDKDGADIIKAMRTADQRMYAEKKRHYSKFPELRR